MKILFSVPRYHPNHDGLVAGLLAAGHEVHFVVRARHSTEFHRPGVGLTFLPGWQEEGRRKLPPFASLNRILMSERPDVVIARNPSRVSLALHALCRLRGIPCLLYIQRESGAETMDARRRAMLRFGLWPAHTVNATCPEPPPPPPGKTCDFLPFAIEPDPAPRRVRSAGAPLEVLSVGKLHQARKNHRAVVAHLAPLLRAGRIRLTLLGLREAGPSEVYDALVAEIAQQDVTGSVRLLENLDYAASRRAYADHDLLVLASSRERASVAPMEAMAAGLPAICGADNGTNFVVKDAETGFVFPDGDFARMAEHVAWCAAHPAELDRMGRTARALIEAEYSPARYVERLDAILRERVGLRLAP